MKKKLLIIIIIIIFISLIGGTIYLINKKSKTKDIDVSIILDNNPEFYNWNYDELKKLYLNPKIKEDVDSSYSSIKMANKKFYFLVEGYWNAYNLNEGISTYFANFSKNSEALFAITESGKLYYIYSDKFKFLDYFDENNKMLSLTQEDYATLQNKEIADNIKGVGIYSYTYQGECEPADYYYAYNDNEKYIIKFNNNIPELINVNNYFSYDFIMLNTLCNSNVSLLSITFDDQIRNNGIALFDKKTNDSINVKKYYVSFGKNPNSEVHYIIDNNDNLFVIKESELENKYMFKSAGKVANIDYKSIKNKQLDYKDYSYINIVLDNGNTYILNNK